MTHAFLSEDWFAEYDRLRESVEVPPALSKVVANLRVNRDDGSVYEARIESGFLRPGFSATASSTITASEPLIYQAIVLGDARSAMPAVFSGQLRIEGDKAALVKLAMATPTPSQRAFTERLKELTSIAPDDVSD